MKFDCLLTGIGGQGSVLAAKILAQTALEQGYAAQTFERLGMAQRGGSVASHLRIGRENIGPVIPLHQADLLIGLEPAEALRHLPYLKGGSAIINKQPAFTGSTLYAAEAVLNELRQNLPQAIFVDGAALCRHAGNFQTINVILLGLAAKKNLLPFSPEAILQSMKKVLPEKLLAVNQQAFAIGAAAAKQKSRSSC